MMNVLQFLCVLGDGRWGLWRQKWMMGCGGTAWFMGRTQAPSTRGSQCLLELVAPIHLL